MMPYQIEWSTKAELDVDRTLLWFDEQRASAAAAHWLKGLREKVRSLQNNPERCPMAAEAEDVGLPIRELLFGKRSGRYRILFQIEGDIVRISHVRHSARDRFGLGDV